MKMFQVLAVAAGLAAAATASYAAPITGGEPLGQKLAEGKISEQQFEQLIAFTGLTPDQAKQATVDEIVAKRWQEN